MVARATLIAFDEPERLGEHVVDSGRFEDGAGRAAGDDTGTGRGGLHQHARRVVLTDDHVRDRGARERDGEEVLAGLFHALLDRGRDLFGLAVTEAHVAVAVADHHERGEREAPAALDDLGDPVDRDHSFVVLTFSHVNPIP